MPGYRYIPHRNLEWQMWGKREDEFGTGESGIPDSRIHKPQSKLAYVEFKSFLGRLVFGDWRDNQREWYVDNCLAPGCETEYWLCAHVTWDRTVPRLNNDRADMYLVPAVVWLETESAAEMRGQKGIAPVAANGRVSERDFALDLLWSNYKLTFDGKWVIPPNHPFNGTESTKIPVGEPARTA
jgi:hypothetical protein